MATVMPETPREKYDRLRRTVQETILNEYPNPDRLGCPENAMIREVAFREELTKDPIWEHITHCSPCYAEFLKFKEEWRANKVPRRTEGEGSA
jgi:hypothetical protein